MQPTITSPSTNQTNAEPSVLQSGAPVKTAESAPPDTTPIQNKAMDILATSPSENKAIAPTAASDVQSPDYNLEIASMGVVGGGNLPWSPSLSNAVPQVGPFQQLQSSFEEGFIGGPTRELNYIAWNQYHKIVDDSIPLTPDQRKQLQASYPDFDYPQGVDSKEAEYLTQMQLTQLRNNFLNSQADTFWQKGAAYIGNAVGGFMNAVPLAAGIIGAAMFAPEEAGIAVAGTLATAYRLAAYKAAPIVYAAGASASEEMAEAGYDYHMGKKYDAVQGMLNFSLATAMGTAFTIGDIAFDPKARSLLGKTVGSKLENPEYLKKMLDVSDYNLQERFPTPSYALPIRPKEEHTPETIVNKVDEIIGSSKMVSPEDDETLHKMAISQLLSGKDIDLVVPIKKATYEEGKTLRNRFVEAGINPSIVADSVEETQKSILDNLKNTASELEISNIKLSAPQTEAGIASLQEEQVILNKQMKILNSTKNDYESGKITAEKENMDSIINKFGKAGLDTNIANDLLNDEPQLLYKHINDISNKIKRNDILQGVRETSENIQKENRMLKDKIISLRDEYGYHDFVKSALRNELVDVTPDEIKAHVRYTMGADIRDDVIGDNRPTIKDLSEEQNKVMGDLKEEVDNTDLNSLKSDEKGFEEHNKELDESAEEIKKSDRRISKLPKLIESAINCLRKTQ